MNTKIPLSFGVASFLDTLTELFESGDWVAFNDGRKIRFRQRDSTIKWTPLTAVIYSLTGEEIGSSEEERIDAMDLFTTTNDQFWQIVLAEDGPDDGSAGYSKKLRHRLEGFVLASSLLVVH